MDDAELWQRFAAQDLTQEEWNHALHLRTGYLHLSRYDFDDAHVRLRAGIIRLNQRHGLIESVERGYFETLTRVWLQLVDVARRRHASSSSLELLERCPELLERSLPSRYYSKGLLKSARARAIYVEPDLEMLPTE